MDIEIDYNPSPSTHYFISIGLNNKEAISFDNTSKGFRVIKQVLIHKEKQNRSVAPRKISGEWDAIILKDGKFVKKYHVLWQDNDKLDTVNGETWETVWEKPISKAAHEKLLEYSRFISDHYEVLERYPQTMADFESFMAQEIANYTQLKIIIFTEGTILMHQGGLGHTREEIVQQVKDKEKMVKDYVHYVPIRDAVRKIQGWTKQGAEIIYLTSRREEIEIQAIEDVLVQHGFPDGSLEYRKGNEAYKDVAERIQPDVLIEDDCESIGGEKEITISHIRPDIKDKIKSLVVREFAGIDDLPDDIYLLKV